MKGWFNPALSAEQKMLKFALNNNGHLMTALVQDFNQDLYHYLYSQSDQHTAEDVVQTTWLKVIEKRHLFSLDKNFKSWLFTLARNSLIDELRRQQRWQFVEIDESLHLTSTEYAQLQQYENLQLVFDQLLNKLPFNQREVFVLQQEGFSLDEIAIICGVKKETIKSRLRYARDFFKRYLEVLSV